MTWSPVRFIPLLACASLAAAPAVPASPASPLLAPGLWCEGYNPEEHSCATVRHFEGRPGGAAMVRQLSAHFVRREGLHKIVIEFQVQLDGAALCYDAGFTVLDGLQLYRSADRSPGLTAADTPLPRAELESHLVKSGVRPALAGQRICLSMPEADWTLIPPAQTAAIRLRDF